MYKRKLLNKCVVLCCMLMSIAALTGCDISDLKQETYVELQGDNFAKVNKKDEKFNEIVENGEIEETPENNVETQQPQQQINIYTLDGPKAPVTFGASKDWYESTSNATKALTAKGNIDQDMSEKFANKVFCDINAYKKMYVYAIPSNDFGSNLVAASTFGKNSEKKIREKMGSYPVTTDIQYNVAGDVAYSYQIFSGEVIDNKTSIVSQVSFTRGACIIGEQTIIVEFYVTTGADTFDEEQALMDFFTTISENNVITTPTPETTPEE